MYSHWLWCYRKTRNRSTHISSFTDKGPLSCIPIKYALLLTVCHVNCSHTTPFSLSRLLSHCQQCCVPIQFDPTQNNAAECHFHPGAPLFHEGLKSYTCCKDTNKPVLSFEEFLKIPGCTTGSHSSEKSEVKAPVVTANAGENAPISSSESTSTSTAQTESAKANPSSPARSGSPSTFRERPTQPSIGVAASTQEEEQDAEDAVIPEDTHCKRAGCKAVYHKGMERTSEECVHHPLPAIFHEGSKGYACCKRRVLEFDEFLKIGGCKKSRHCFVGQPKPRAEGEDELVQCRHDMFQTPTQVRDCLVSVNIVHLHFAE